jgi:hypothetical protein
MTARGDISPGFRYHRRKVGGGIDFLRESCKAI